MSDASKKIDKTFYSGYVWVSIVLFAILFLALFYSSDLYVVITDDLLFGIIFFLIICAAYLALLFFWGKGTYALTVTEHGLIYRKAFSTKIIPASSIRAIRYDIKIISSGRGQEVKEYIRIAQLGRDDVVTVITIPIRFFSKKVRREFFSLFFSCHSSVAIHNSLCDYLNKLGIETANPTTSEFPRDTGASGDLLKSLGLRPEFTEATLFLMAISLIALTILDPHAVLSDILAIVDFAASSRKGGTIVMFLGIMAVGLVVSAYQLLRRGTKSKFSVYTMSVFGIGMSTIAGVFSGLYIFENDTGWAALVLSLYNIFYGLGILFSASYEEEDGFARRIRNDDAKLHEVIIGLVVISIILCLGKFYFHANWVFIFSACVAYASGLNTYIEKLFPRFHKKMPEFGVELPYMDAVAEKGHTWMSANRSVTYVLFFVLIFVSVFGLRKIMEPKDTSDNYVAVNYYAMTSVHIAKHFDLEKPSIAVGFEYEIDGKIIDVNITSIDHFKEAVQKIIANRARLTFDTLEPDEVALAHRAIEEQWLGSFRPMLFLFLTNYRDGTVEYYYNVENREEFLRDRSDAEYWRVMFDLYDYLQSQ